MTDISVDIPFVAEDVPDPATLTNPQLLAVGRQVAQRAWATAQTALAPPTDEAAPFGFGSNVVAVVHRDPAQGKDKWVFATVPFSGELSADAASALAALAVPYNVNPANFTAQQRSAWGPFVFEAVRNQKP